MKPPIVAMTVIFRNGTTLRIGVQLGCVSAAAKWEAIDSLESRVDTWRRDGILKHRPDDKPHEHLTVYPWHAVDSISIDVEPPTTPNESNGGTN